MTTNNKLVVASVTAVTLAAVTVTQSALDFTSSFEGTFLEAYLDPVNIPTICAGHTDKVKLGMIATVEMCNKYLSDDWLVAKRAIQNCLPEDLKLYPRQWDMLIDFGLNVGPGKKGLKDGFCVLKSGKSSTLRLKVIAGDCVGAANQFPFWSSAGGKTYRGLVRRNDARKAEYLKWCIN